MVVSIVMGLPQELDGKGKSHLEMDDKQGYPHGLETPHHHEDGTRRARG